MSDSSVIKENTRGDSYLIHTGTVEDFEFLPKQIGNPKQRGESKIIQLGPLEYDFSEAKTGLESGKSQLRVAKNNSGKIIGFTILFKDKPYGSIIDIIWVDSNARREQIASNLMIDALNHLPSGQISVDIWGGEPAIKLAEKFGFRYNPGGQMVRRYTLDKH